MKMANSKRRNYLVAFDSLLRRSIPYIYIISMMFFVFSALIDILVSYAVFTYATKFFIDHEACRIFVEDILTKGFPSRVLMIHAVLIALYSALIYLSLRVIGRAKELKNDYIHMFIYTIVSTLVIMSTVMVFFVSIAHIFGALSWIQF